METEFTAQPAAQLEDGAVIDSAPASEELSDVLDTSKKDGLVSERLARLQRREKQLKQREAELAELRKQMDAGNSSKEEVVSEPELSWEEKARRNPFSALQELGYSADDILQIMANDGNIPDSINERFTKKEKESALERKIAELEARLEQRDVETAQVDVDAQIAQFQQQIKQEVLVDPERFELIAATDSFDLVYDLIEANYKETGRILEISEAALALEEHLLAEHKERIGGSKKLKSLFGANNSTEATMTDDEATAKARELFGEALKMDQAPSPSLSNNHQLQSPSINQANLSDEELLKEAAKLMIFKD